MSDAGPSDLEETLRLVTALAEQLTRSQLAEGSISPARLKVLISAARFLHDNNVPWPPVVREAMGKVADRMEAARSPSGDSEADA
jgi:hypothetical protein